MFEEDDVRCHKDDGEDEQSSQMKDSYENSTRMFFFAKQIK